MKGNLADVLGYRYVKGESDLVEMLNEVGPISVGFFASSTLRDIGRGVYDYDPECKNPESKFKMFLPNLLLE